MNFISCLMNGQPQRLPQGLNVEQLLKHLHWEQKKNLAIAINGEVVPGSAHSSTVVKENDRIEIITPMAGG